MEKNLVECLMTCTDRVNDLFCFCSPRTVKSPIFPIVIVSLYRYSFYFIVRITMAKIQKARFIRRNATVETQCSAETMSVYSVNSISFLKWKIARRSERDENIRVKIETSVRTITLESAIHRNFRLHNCYIIVVLGEHNMVGTY